MSLRISEVFKQRRPRQHPERDAQNAIVKYLRVMGCLVAVTDAGAAYRAGSFGGDTVPKGWPDITGCLPNGRFLGVEVKAPKGRQSDDQKRTEADIIARHGVYILARSIDDVERAMGWTQK